jgi:hypothetical protein
LAEGYMRLLVVGAAALFFACTLESVLVWLHITPAIAPVMTGTSVGESQPGAERPKRDDFMIPEIHVENAGARSPQGFAVEVKDDLPQTTPRTEFPMGQM